MTRIAMFKSLIGAIMVLTLFELLKEPTQAQSLWKRRDEQFAFFFVDTRAHDVGDLVTVLISEATDVQNSDRRALDKSSESSFKFDFAGSGNSGSSSASLDMGGDASRKFDGNSQYTVAQEFTDRITVPVVEVLPNGNLLISGKRRRLVTDETRELEISGIVRPVDIGANNTIQSQFVANLQIRYVGCGPESHFTHQGWASRVMTRLWPF